MFFNLLIFSYLRSYQHIRYKSRELFDLNQGNMIFVNPQYRMGGVDIHVRHLLIEKIRSRKKKKKCNRSDLYKKEIKYL